MRIQSSIPVQKSNQVSSYSCMILSGKKSLSEEEICQRGVDRESSSGLQNVTPFMNVFLHPFFSLTLNVCEWASHLSQQYYSVQLTGHFPEYKKQRPVCFYGFSLTGDLSGILHTEG